MLKNYLKIAWRSLWKHKISTAINVGGLAVGLACCLLIGLYVWDEWSYDRFHERSDRIVQVLMGRESGDGFQRQAATPPPLANALSARFPSVERTVQLTRRSAVLRNKSRAFQEEVLFADPSFFEVFSFELRAGNPAQVLAAPGQAVLSSSAAQRYFGSKDAVGETFEVELDDSLYTYQVAGLAHDTPSNSTLDANVVLSSLDIRLTRVDAPEWSYLSSLLFAQLSTAQARESLSRELPEFTEELHSRGLPEQLSLQLLPLIDRRFTPDVRGQIGEATPPVYSYILLSIAGLILLTACVNFTTLSVSRSAYRAREVGMRKTLGAQRGQIAGQFLSEALLLTAAALLVGIALAQGLMPVFNTLVGKELSLQPVWQPAGVLVLLGLFLLVGLLAGSYPALYLSRFSPIEVIRRQPQIRGRTRLTQVLVVGQFALAVFLIACTVVMTRQFGLMQAKDLGFDPENVVQIQARHPGLSSSEMLARYRSMLTEQTAVRSVTGSSLDLLSDQAGSGTFVASGPQEVEAHTLRLETGGVETLGLELLAGHSLAESRQDEGVLVNESFAKAMGWDDSIGHRISGSVLSNAPIVGVVADFHFRSLHHPIEPVVIHRFPHWSMPNIYVRLTPGTLPDALGMLESVWAEAFPGAPFQHAFMDEIVARQYESEQRWTRVVTAATLLALFIAGLGLFGLTSMASVQRRKEIGIRKVLGATAASVVALLSKDFLKLVATGFIIAAPVAYYVMQRWLENFAYRVEIGPGMFFLTGLAAFTVALLAVSYHALRAAWMNPTEAIRYE